MRRFFAVLSLLIGLLAVDMAQPADAEAQCWTCHSAAPYPGEKCSEWPDGWVGWQHCATGISGGVFYCNGFFICWYTINGECVTTQDDLTPQQRETVEEMLRQGRPHDEISAYVASTTISFDEYVGQELARRKGPDVPVTSFKVGIGFAR